MNKPLDPKNLYLTVAQVAERYNVSVDTIWRWSRYETMPKPVKIGPNITRWRLSDLVEYESCFRAGLVFAIEDFAA